MQGQEEAPAKVGEGGADREGRAKRSVGAGCAAPSRGVGGEAVCGRPVGRIPIGTFKHTGGGVLNRGSAGACPLERRSSGRSPRSDAEEEVIV